MHSLVKMLRTYGCLLVAVYFFSTSCTNDKEEVFNECCNDRINYSDNLKAILTTNCAIPSCHDGNSPLVALNTYEKVKQKADDSTLYKRVIQTRLMPPISQPPLSDCEFEQFKCWLQNGAGN